MLGKIHWVYLMDNPLEMDHLDSPMLVMDRSKENQESMWENWRGNLELVMKS